MKINAVLLSATLLFSAATFAQNWYADGGIGFIEFDDGVDSVSPTNFYMRGGYQFSEYFNVGLETSVTASSDSISDVDFDVDVVTFYLRGGVPVNESVWIYAQLGRSNTELTAEYQGVELSSDDDDTMLGLGVEVDLGSDKTYLALNYSKYNDNDGVDVTGFNLGIGFRF